MTGSTVLTIISDTRWKFCLKCGLWDLGSGHTSDSDDEADWEYNSHRSHSSVGSSDPIFQGGLLQYHDLWFASPNNYKLPSLIFARCQPECEL